MSLYLGADKLKIKIDNIAHILNIRIAVPHSDGVRLKSLEGFLLKDGNGNQMFARKE